MGTTSLSNLSRSGSLGFPQLRFGQMVSLPPSEAPKAFNQEKGTNKFHVLPVNWG